MGRNISTFFLSLSVDLSKAQVLVQLAQSAFHFSRTFSLFHFFSPRTFFPAGAFVCKRLSPLRFAVRLKLSRFRRSSGFRFPSLSFAGEENLSLWSRGLFGFDLTKIIFIATSWLARTKVGNKKNVKKNLASPNGKTFYVI